MNKLFAKGFLNKHLGFFIFAVVLLWIKTYAAYQTEFSLGIDNAIQQFLLFVNPISSAVLFLGLALFAKGKKAFIWIIIIDFLMSFLLYANLVYYRFFNDFITVPTLTQTKNAGDLGQSLGALVKPYDVLYFLDVVILMVLVFGKFVKPENVRMKGKRVATVIVSAFVLFGANLALAEMDRPQLLTRTFDRNYLVKYLGMYNYTIYDAIQSSKSSAQRALADSNDVTEVLNYTKATQAKPNPEYFGKAEGMNVIYISLESLQTFAIDYKINGEEVTPFLNSLTKDKNTLYFDNFFHQTGQGKTSDAEFMVENSLYPLPQGAVFTTKAENTYQAAPAIMDQKGYSTGVFHGNYKSFWNRDVMYKSLGYEQFFDAEYYSMKEEDVVNYGLKDKPFFEESIPLLKSMEQPFYTKFISLTNHFPYPIEEDEATIDPHTTGDGSVDRYFQTARYMDESLQQFFEDLKKSGMYDNTMIVMYGDHYGISENHNKAMSQVMGKEINGFEHAQLQRVPLFIHAPGLKGGQQHQFGGTVDIRPTVLNLLGVDTKDYIQMGTDLMSKDHQQVVPFRNGDFVTPEFTSVDGKFYDTKTGDLVKENEEIKQTEEMVDKKLTISDKIVYGDLLRFHTPEGFKKVDPNQYRYMGPDEKEE
ncbi:LTA synthase family protein [Metabacillus sp. SLBN-84]